MPSNSSADAEYYRLDNAADGFLSGRISIITLSTPVLLVSNFTQFRGKWKSVGMREEYGVGAELS